MTLQTVLELSFAGPQGSTQIVDTSPSAHTFWGTAYSIDIVGGEPRLRLTGQGSLIGTSDSTDFSFANADFEIGLQVRFASAVGNAAFITQYNSADGNDMFELSHRSGNGLRLLIKRGGSTILDIAESANAMQMGVDYNILVKRTGASIVVSRNGLAICSGSLSGFMPDPTSPFYIGYGFYTTSASVYFDGWVDNVVIRKDDQAPSVPPPSNIWRRIGNIMVPRLAPIRSSLIFMNSYTGTYMACGVLVPSLPAVGAWNRLDLRPLGLPAETVAIDVRGFHIITNGNNSVLTDLAVAFKAPSATDLVGNYNTQAIAWSPQGGARQHGTAVCPVENLFIDWAWLRGETANEWPDKPLANPWPAGASYGLNLTVQTVHIDPAIAA